jgi:hypothetical protein
MKLKSSGVFISILILIIMILICHTMNFFYPKNKFTDVSTSRNSRNSRNNKTTPEKTDYNEIYYSNESDKKQLCANVNQAQIPCDIVRTCITDPTPIPTPTPTPTPEITTAPTSGLSSLSNSELTVLYKVAYEASAREIFTRALKDIKDAARAESMYF